MATVLLATGYSLREGGLSSSMQPRRHQSVESLDQALREKTREVDVLHRISESISNTLDLEAVLEHIVAR